MTIKDSAKELLELLIYLMLFMAALIIIPITLLWFFLIGTLQKEIILTVLTLSLSLGTISLTGGIFLYDKGPKVGQIVLFVTSLTFILAGISLLFYYTILFASENKIAFSGWGPIDYLISNKGLFALIGFSAFSIGIFCLIVGISYLIIKSRKHTQKYLP